MTQHQASRTLVKSPPELWAQCSEDDSLGRHLEGFGEIRITRLEPETAVAWEGEQISGTVRLEPSGWGTKVILTAEPALVEPEPSVSPADPPPIHLRDDPDEPEQRGVTRRGLLGRLLGKIGLSSSAQDEPPPNPPDAVGGPPASGAPDPPASPAPHVQALDAALDSLGRAHRRPFAGA